MPKADLANGRLSVERIILHEHALLTGREAALGLLKFNLWARNIRVRASAGWYLPR